MYPNSGLLFYILSKLNNKLLLLSFFFIKIVNFSNIILWCACWLCKNVYECYEAFSDCFSAHIRTCAHELITAKNLNHLKKKTLLEFSNNLAFNLNQNIYFCKELVFKFDVNVKKKIKTEIVYFNYIKNEKKNCLLHTSHCISRLYNSILT